MPGGSGFDCCLSVSVISRLTIQRIKRRWLTQSSSRFVRCDTFSNSVMKLFPTSMTRSFDCSVIVGKSVINNTQL